MDKMIKFLMIFWLIICLVSVGICIYLAVVGYHKDAILFLGFAVMGLVMFYINKRRLKNYGSIPPPSNQ